MSNLHNRLCWEKEMQMLGIDTEPTGENLGRAYGWGSCVDCEKTGQMILHSNGEDCWLLCDECTAADIRKSPSWLSQVELEPCSHCIDLTEDCPVCGAWYVLG